MSSVILQVGQCGNQIGEYFWKKTTRDDTSEKCYVYKSHDGHLRSLNNDSESKVVRKLQKSFKIRDSNIVYGKRGRGTNWALGYNGLKTPGDDHMLEDTLESLRKESERCDYFSGILLFHSLSGGTGSGFGSRLCQEIRDIYPLQYLLACSVTPYMTGESPLQHYNTTLTMSALQRYTDGVILIHNDEMLNRVRKQSDTEGASFVHVNTAIADLLCGVLLPTDTLKNKGISVGQEPWEMIRSICPMPELKFMTIGHAAKSQLSWEGLVSNITQAHRNRDHLGNPIPSISSLIVARGDPTGSFFRNLTKMEERIKSVYHHAPWNPFPVDFWSAKSYIPGVKGQSSVTIATNTAGVMEFLDTVSYKSQLMFSQKAYLHWYQKYGVTEDDFTDAFESMASIYQSYSEAIQ